MNLIDPVRPYLGAAALALALGIGVWIFTLNERLKAAESQTQAARAALALSHDANVTNLHTIAALKASNAVWQKSAEASTAAAAQAALDLAAARRDREHAAALLHAKEQTDTALPACNKLLAVDILQACPAHAAAIRQRAAP